ncbi:hypothetical protein [Anaerobutyricum hallii]|uniref:hypothetical protein n=1 Tax=Anaerobutyricum hallii TaxID=39488 RepID=UPI002ED61620
MVTKRTEEIKNDKIQRILGIYTKLIEGKTVKKEEEVQHYKVNPRTIQRDIQDITAFLERDDLNTGIINSIIYDTKARGYRLQYNNVYKLSPQQILAICKILLDSRAFVKEEMTEIIDKLIHSSVIKDDQPQVENSFRMKKSIMSNSSTKLASLTKCGTSARLYKIRTTLKSNINGAITR